MILNKNLHTLLYPHTLTQHPHITPSHHHTTSSHYTLTPSHNTLTPSHYTLLTGYRRCEAQFVSDEKDTCCDANIDLVSVWRNIPVFTKVGEEIGEGGKGGGGRGEGGREGGRGREGVEEERAERKEERERMKRRGSEGGRNKLVLVMQVCGRWETQTLSQCSSQLGTGCGQDCHYYHCAERARNNPRLCE